MTSAFSIMYRSKNQSNIDERINIPILSFADDINSNDCLLNLVQKVRYILQTTSKTSESFLATLHSQWKLVMKAQIG